MVLYIAVVNSSKLSNKYKKFILYNVFPKLNLNHIVGIQQYHSDRNRC